MDTEGWFLIGELLGKANRYVYAHGSRVRSAMRVDDMARIAPDGTEQLTKMRWQFSVISRSMQGMVPHFGNAS